MAMYRVLDLFSGIGGFSLGLERTGGFRTVAFCEIESFPRKILSKHWPNVPIFEDVRKLHAEDLPEPVDVVCGGYPCQPFSLAGKRKGASDDRHLWPEMFRLVQEIRPHWIIAENVAGHINMGLDEVLSNLEAEGYETAPFVIPACAVDAPHRRDRVWIIANHGGVKHQSGCDEIERETAKKLPFCNSERCGCQRNNRRWSRPVAPHGCEDVPHSSNPRAESMRQWEDRVCGFESVADAARFMLNRMGNIGKTRGDEPANCGCNGADSTGILPRHGVHDDVERIVLFQEGWERLCSVQTGARWTTEPDVDRVAHGVSRRVDRLKALGNAVVPQVVEVIGSAILMADEVHP